VLRGALSLGPIFFRNSSLIARRAMRIFEFKADVARSDETDRVRTRLNIA
jgi:hypothetical protein